MLSEALTQRPHGFVFREPRLAEDRFVIRKADAELFAEHGIDLEGFVDDWDRGRDGSLLAAFARNLLPRLQKRAAQIGVKEISHAGWRRYLETFPEMKIVLTARDPRDIYISLWHRVQGGKLWRGDFTPERVAATLDEEFRHQLDMKDTTTCLRVRYEDLCLHPETFDVIKHFVGSPIPRIGEVGAFNASNPRRADEFELHGDQITAQRVGRWRREAPERRALAQRTFDLMGDYCDFWGYSA